MILVVELPRLHVAKPSVRPALLCSQAVRRIMADDATARTFHRRMAFSSPVNEVIRARELRFVL